MRETALHRHIAAANAALPARVTIPPGDDMAAIELGGRSLLVAVDQVADGVHLDVATAGLAAAGRKAVTRNLSDVAAMAAVPVACVVSAMLPRGFDEASAKALFDAVRETGEAYGCPLIGGDTGVHDAPLVLSVTVLAEPDGVEPVTRRGARPGDRLYVTGTLGHSIAGHHLSFEPRLAVARTLADGPATRPRAMIDLSDGLAADLPRLCDHAVIDADRLPIRDGTPEPVWRHAVGDGEDYELLFAVDAGVSLPAEVAGVPITRIGRVTAEGGVCVRLPDGSIEPLTGLGWEHAT